MLVLLVPSIANPMYGYISREIETAAQERHGHRVLLGNTYRNKDKETGFFEDLLAHVDLQTWLTKGNLSMCSAQHATACRLSDSGTNIAKEDARVRKPNHQVRHVSCTSLNRNST
jgi:hypothetical protein